MARFGFTSLAAVLAVGSFVVPAQAQTWSVGTTPELEQLIAIDGTGETGWLWGSENLEPSVDIRTVYASTNAMRWFVRAYVSDTAAPPATVSVYFFVDSDNNPATGGGADANEINAAFTTDPSNGGYEYVVGVAGNGTIIDIWEWNAGPAFTSINPMPADASAEAGTDTDPLLVGSDTHGYLQAMVNLGVVGLTQACDASIFVRSINSAGDSDLDVGALEECLPPDSDSDGLPDIIDDSNGCTSDDQCPGDLVCDNGDCVVGTAPECTTDADCAPNEECNAQGECVIPMGGACTSNADCGNLVCKGTPQTCQGCTPGSDECGPGRHCTNASVCEDDVTTGAGGAGGEGFRAPDDALGEDVEGGACACALWENRGRSGFAALLFGVVAAVALRLRRRSPRR